jgi:acyl-coenzyme A synthetase/AMP-(fatty) acid ligase
VLSHRAVLERTEAAARLLGVSERDVVLTPLSLSYHFVASALSCMRVGSTLLDCVDLAPAEVVAHGVEHGATMMYGSPIHYELLTRAAHGSSFPRLRRAISTAALLSPETAAAFQAAFGCRLTQVYGVIEVGLPLWNDSESFQPASLGVCRAPYECMILSDAGTLVQVGEVGELLLRGPGSFSGYVIDGAVGVPHNGDGWFATGDLVTCGADGVLTYRGRKKSVINCGGHKVFPEEVEAVLVRIPGIVAARVSAEPHPILGNIVIAEIVLDELVASTREEWRTICYRELSAYKVPKEFRIVTSLPLTGSGKVVRHTAPLHPEEFKPS